MAQYRKRSTGEILSKEDIMQRYPHTSFPKVWNQSTLDFLRVDPILPSPKPSPSARKIGAVKDAKGNWVEKWGR